MDTEPRTGRLRDKSKYVLPNVITATSLVMGLISIFFAHNHNYVTAGWVIMYSVVLDKLDGSTARALKASSDFGVQFDSFSDFIAFGIAPAFLVFMICTGDPAVSPFFDDADRFFLYFSLIFFVLTSAMRLARFNVTTFPGSKYMIGMATTIAGGLIATCILTCYAHKDVALFQWMLRGLPYYLLLLGGLEVSNFPMTKIGSSQNKARLALEVVGFFLMLLLILVRKFPEFLFVTGMAVVIQGFISAFSEKERVLAGMRPIRSVIDSGSEAYSDTTDDDSRE